MTELDEPAVPRRRHLHVGTDDVLRLESRPGRELSTFGLVTEGPLGAQHAVPEGELAALCGARPRRVWSSLLWSARDRPWSLCADCADQARTGTA
jgi:hypothetical protein